MASIQRILLFDIDGTLLLTSSGGQALKKAIGESFSIKSPNCNVNFSGRTDRSIVSEILQLNELPVTTENFNRVRDIYLTLLNQALANSRAKLLPGVDELMSSLDESKESVLTVVMTGNFVEAAKIKLEYFNLSEHFAHIFGGAEDHHRDDLARRTKKAVMRLLEKMPVGSGPSRNPSDADEATSPVTGKDDIECVHQSPSDQQFIVIGDTPADIRCAKAINAKVLAVCTGGYDRDQLQAEEPDYVFKDLSDTQAVLKALLTD